MNHVTESAWFIQNRTVPFGMAGDLKRFDYTPEWYPQIAENSHWRQSVETLQTLVRRALIVGILAAGLLRSMEPLIAAPPEGFVALFNGKDLDGWKGLVATPEKRAAMKPEERAEAQKHADANMKEHGAVVDGEMVFDGKGDSLCTIEDYGDFELFVDWKILEGGDSGIYLRGSPQVQSWDTKFKKYQWPGADKGSGAFWNNKTHPRFPIAHADKLVGEWNTFLIRMVSGSLVHGIRSSIAFSSSSRLIVRDTRWPVRKAASCC